MTPIRPGVRGDMSQSLPALLAAGGSKIGRRWVRAGMSAWHGEKPVQGLWAPGCSCGENRPVRGFAAVRTRLRRSLRPCGHRLRSISPRKPQCVAVGSWSRSLDGVQGCLLRGHHAALGHKVPAGVLLKRCGERAYRCVGSFPLRPLMRDEGRASVVHEDLAVEPLSLPRGKWAEKTHGASGEFVGRDRNGVELKRTLV